jgi:hypothetical protein
MRPSQLRREERTVVVGQGNDKDVRMGKSCLPLDINRPRIAEHHFETFFAGVHSYLLVAFNHDDAFAVCDKFGGQAAPSFTGASNYGSQRIHLQEPG